MKLWHLLPLSIREILEAPYRREARIEIGKILRKANEKKLRVLDVGAGDGFAGKWFKHHAYTAMDVAPFNRGTADVHGIDVVGDAQNIPFGDNSFDFVLCLEALECVLDPAQALRELYRVLENGGTAVISTPLLSAGYCNDRQRWSLPGLRVLIEGAGFQIQSIKPMGGYYRMLGWQISKLSGRVRKPDSMLLSPFYYLVKIPVGLIFQIIIPLILFSLDFLDKKKHDTCGYVVMAEKQA